MYISLATIPRKLLPGINSKVVRPRASKSKEEQELRTKEKAEVEIYKFIANLFECNWEEVRDMDPVELLDKLEQVADIEKWKSFFKRVAALMKKK